MTNKRWFYAIAVVTLLGAVALWWLIERSNTMNPGSMDADNDLTTQEFRADDLTLELALDPPVPTSGDNSLLIDLRDESGQALSGASIEAQAVMPAMGAMAEMRAPLRIEDMGDGRYRGTFELPMDGSWPLELTLSHPRTGEENLSFAMATGRRGLELRSGGAAMAEMSEMNMAMDEQASSEPGAALGPSMVIDARRRQMIGVRTTPVQQLDLQREIIAPGVVKWDETGFHDVTLRVDGWIGELFAEFVGQTVVQGAPLFTVYNPRLLSAQEDYLAALRPGSRELLGDDSLLTAARRRLELWGLQADQIRELEERGEALDYVPVLAPTDGVVVALEVASGAAVSAGETIMRIADHSRVWVEAQVYDADLALVQEGMAARIDLPALSTEPLNGEVDYIYPSYDAGSRSARIRFTLSNPDATLKPDMYAEVRLQAELGPRLVVPETAVLIAGELRVVFRDLGDGRLQPVRVRTGQRAEGYVEIIAGLSDDDVVVTSGTFLVASESRLQGGLEQW